MDDFYTDDLSDFLNSPIPWPTPNHDLQRIGHDRNLVALPGYTIDFDPWYTYCEGYRSAVNMIFNAIKADTGRSADKDVLIHPFVMLWRHYTELQLKSLCAYMRSRSGMGAPMKAPSHWLDRLWRETRDLIEASPYNVPGELPDVERVILQLHKIDPTSEHSRYPLTTKGTPAFVDLGPLDLSNFHCAMENVANFLETLPDVLDEAYSFHAEKEAEYYGDTHNW